jgi:ketosteroid isomerase-like protein
LVSSEVEQRKLRVSQTCLAIARHDGARKIKAGRVRGCAKRQRRPRLAAANGFGEMRGMDANGFAAEWCAAWNAHDLDRVLAHFHEEVSFTSPAAAALFPETRGRIEGRQALRDYWSEGLRRIPDLHFTIERVFAGVGAIVIQYRNQKGVSVSEVLVFDGDKVRSGHGTYPVEAAG